MIRYLTKNEVDMAKYNNCILRSYNSLIYGFNWYLNAVCDDWDVLVLNDYMAVMPLPKRKKYGINYVYQAPWIQQLGVFSIQPIESSLLKEFIKKIPKKFKMVDVMLNANNEFTSKHIISRNNFVLSLDNKSYQALQKAYSKGRKSSVKQALKFNLKIQLTSSAEALIDLFKENKGKELNRADYEYLQLRNLVDKGMLLSKVIIYNVYNQNEKLLGGAIFLKDKHRITYLFSALDNEGREKQAMSFLIDFVIKKYANKPLLLDFEGSMVPKIASFYKSFGAKKEIYFHYKKWQLL